MRCGAPGDRHEEAGELDEESRRRVWQVLPREESTPGKPTLAQRGATHEAKRRGARERAGRWSPETPFFEGADAVRPGGRPRRRSEQRGRGPAALSGVVEFGTLAHASCTGTGRPRRCLAAKVGGGQPREGDEPQAARARTLVGAMLRRRIPRGIGRGHGTEEVGEDVGNARRVDGGTGRGRGEPDPQTPRRTQDRESGLARGEGRNARRARRRIDHRQAHHRRSCLISRLRRPEVGARCGKSARRVLSGGRPERAVPTGTGRGAASGG